MAEPHSALAHHFHDLQQQRESAELGMWLFLVTEIMFFGAIFAAYFVYRFLYPDEFAALSSTMDVTLGTINTAVLLTSSFTMALSVHAAHESHRKQLLGYLTATMVLGTVFLGIKAYEYHHKYEEHLIPFFQGFRFSAMGQEGASVFLNLYFAMTGLHALHMIIGLGLMGTLCAMAYRGDLLGDRSTLVHNAGLYWHFVDLVWVYLFPFFYLVGTAGTGMTH